MKERDFSSVKTLVVKLGTSIMTGEDGRFSPACLGRLVRDIVQVLVQRRVRVILVTSGAIGLGMEVLGLKRRPRELAALQACAAIGQGKLMRLYEENFSRSGFHTAQLLLTREEFQERHLYLNVRRTLAELLDRGIVPIVNENDTVATQEIQVGDNDTLAALTAQFVKAELTVILSDVQGFFLKDGTLVDCVGSLDEIDSLRGHLYSRKREHTVGGMATKLRAAEMLMQTGLSLLIASGREAGILDRAMRGEGVGTLFQGAGRRIGSRKSWIAHSARLQGYLIVDAGAEAALLTKGKSLLARGITGVEGDFSPNSTVGVKNLKGAVIGRGRVNYASEEVAKILGRRTDEIAQVLGTRVKDEVIHHNNWVAFRPGKAS